MRAAATEGAGTEPVPTDYTDEGVPAGISEDGGGAELSAHRAGPVVDSAGVTFHLPDQDRTLSAVWLVQEVSWPRSGPEFTWSRDRGGWAVRLARPDVDRMEYLFELLHPDGRSEHIKDPHNPRTSPGAFGDKSVVQFPEYQAPSWLEQTDPEDLRGTTEQFSVATSAGQMHGLLWSSRGTASEDRLPLLVAHDGVEYARFSDLVCMLDVFTRDGGLPPMRAALLHPSPRDEHYSASPAYAQALTKDLLPYLRERAPTPTGRRMRVGMGASLGALAMLHVHRTHPASFGGLFLQSGSFFHHRYDRAELGFEHFQRIRWFMDRVHATTDWDQPPPVTLTCGRVEQNHANNRATSLVLRRQGYTVRFDQVNDAHNWIGWRDAFTPGLVQLLQSVWQ